MEKTLTIDEKSVRFKSNASTVLRYKAQFGRDLFADLMKMYPLMELKKKGIDTENLNYELLQHIDFESLYNLIWTFAKTANKEIPEPIEWLDGFDEFPIMTILPELQELMSHSLQGKKK